MQLRIEDDDHQRDHEARMIPISNSHLKSAGFQSKEMAQKAKEKVLSLVLAKLSKSILHSEDPEMNSSQSEDSSTPGLLSLWNTILADSDKSETTTGLCPNLTE